MRRFKELAETLFEYRKERRSEAEEIHRRNRRRSKHCVTRFGVADNASVLMKLNVLVLGYGNKITVFIRDAYPA